MRGHQYKDRAGQRFGRLTVVKDVGRTKTKRVLWLCHCGCGNETIVASNNLTGGKTQSCGCYMRDRVREASKTHGHYMNGKQTRLYAIWAGMKRRCLNHNVKAYHRYGGRGIKVCAEWMKFEPFRDWATANGYADKLSIDRIDNDGNYEPGNCRWITQKVQCQNTRSNRLITFNGVAKSIAEWAEITGIKAATISARIKRHHWPIEKALTIKPNHGHLSDSNSDAERFKREIEETTGKPTHIC